MKYSQILQFARELRKNQTKAEKFFWSKVRNRRFLGFKFNRQFIIQHASYSYFIADFYCHEKKLIVEIDGKIHDFQLEADLIRGEILIVVGCHIIRFSNEDVLKNWSDVKERLRNELSPNPSL